MHMGNADIIPILERMGMLRDKEDRLLQSLKYLTSRIAKHILEERAKKQEQREQEDNRGALHGAAANRPGSR